MTQLNPGLDCEHGKTCGLGRVNEAQSQAPSGPWKQTCQQNIKNIGESEAIASQ